MKNNFEGTQSILYLGYVLLIVLGILNETLFYRHFGINILEYADILDVLISPISKLTSNIALLIVSLVVILSLLVIPKKSSKFRGKKWVAKFFKIDASETDIDVERKVRGTLIVFSIVFFIGLFIGSGYGKGEKLKDRIELGEVNYDDKIHFIDGQLLKGKLIGKNSSYIFYITKRNSDIKISPISGTIKYLEIHE